MNGCRGRHGRQKATQWVSPTRPVPRGGTRSIVGAGRQYPWVQSCSCRPAAAPHFSRAGGSDPVCVTIGQQVERRSRIVTGPPHPWRSASRGCAADTMESGLRDTVRRAISDRGSWHAFDVAPRRPLPDAGLQRLVQPRREPARVFWSAASSRSNRDGASLDPRPHRPPHDLPRLEPSPTSRSWPGRRGTRPRRAGSSVRRRRLARRGASSNTHEGRRLQARFLEHSARTVAATGTISMRDRRSAGPTVVGLAQDADIDVAVHRAVPAGSVATPTITVLPARFTARPRAPRAPRSMRHGPLVIRSIARTARRTTRRVSATLETCDGVRSPGGPAYHDRPGQMRSRYAVRATRTSTMDGKRLSGSASRAVSRIFLSSRPTAASMSTHRPTSLAHVHS